MGYTLLVRIRSYNEHQTPGGLAGGDPGILVRLYFTGGCEQLILRMWLPQEQVWYSLEESLGYGQPRAGVHGCYKAGSTSLIEGGNSSDHSYLVNPNLCRASVPDPVSVYGVLYIMIQLSGPLQSSFATSSLSSNCNVPEITVRHIPWKTFWMTETLFSQRIVQPLLWDFW